MPEKTVKTVAEKKAVLKDKIKAVKESAKATCTKAKAKAAEKIDSIKMKMAEIKPSPKKAAAAPKTKKDAAAPKTKKAPVVKKVYKQKWVAPFANFQLE